ncbi:MAG: PQQ-binding-like beta-propeller repeat protein [Armatimonadota bacterium]
MVRNLVLAWSLAALAALLCALTAPAALGDITTPMSVQWVFSMGPDPSDVTPPLVYNDRIYVARDGIVHCLDPLTGAEQWKFQPENRMRVSTGPVPYEKLIIVGGNDSAVCGLDAATGAVVWKIGCSGPIAPTPLVAGDRLFLGASQMVYAVKPGTGGVDWICSMAQAAAYGPVTDGSMIYFVGQDGSVQCIDAAAGRYRWGTKLVTGPQFSPPVAASGRLIVASGERVYGVARSGGISYTVEMPAAIQATPTVVGDRLFTPAVDGKIYVLSARSGASLERRTPYSVDHQLTSPPAVTDSTVIVGSADGLVIAMDRSTGAVKWQYRCRAPDQLPNEGAFHGIYSPIVETDGAILCLTGSGDLYRFSASAPDASGPVFGDFEPAAGSAQPGGDYVGTSCSIVDDGSGVDPASVKVTVDGSPVKVTFDAATGEAVTEGKPLPDGPHVVRVSAADYRGNVSSTEWSFVTDVSIIPETAPGTPGQPGMPTRAGAGMTRPGGGAGRGAGGAAGAGRGRY